MRMTFSTTLSRTRRKERETCEPYVYIGAVERGGTVFNELAVMGADRPVHPSIEDSYWIEEDQLSRSKPDILGRSKSRPYRLSLCQTRLGFPSGISINHSSN